MKKIFSLQIVLTIVLSLFATEVSAAPTAQTVELGQLKVCKVAGTGVSVGQLFIIKVNNTNYSVPAGPADGGYCVLAGQFLLNTQVTVQEVIPSGYYVAHIEVKVSDRTVSKDLALGKVVVKIGSGVTEVIFTNKAGTPTPTPSVTPTPKPTRTPTPTPSCAPNCTPTPTPTPKGRLQICKEADGTGVSGYFSFQYGSKTVSVPVGACSPLLTVDAGSLTITEVARAGFSVTDIYTIPASRLLSKNLANRSATVTIVQGYASSQTIVVFRNGTQTPTATSTSTATSTPTITPTGTITPPVCQPTIVTADFSKVVVGQSIEGMGVVAPNLNIDAKGTAIKILKDVQPQMYLAPNSGGINGGLGPSGGFSDAITRNAGQAHLYTFTFAPGTSVSNFSVHMLDFGDLNPSLSTDHFASITAYNVNGAVVSLQELSYTTPAERNPTASNLYGDLQTSGDAASALPGQPGNWTWHLSGSGIVKVVLEFGVGFDPNIGFDTLTFTTECLQGCQPTTVTADFSKVAVGQSIEGMGVVAPDLNIDARETAIKIEKDKPPQIYLAPNSGGINGGLAPGGGFSDFLSSFTQLNQPHLYTFTFAPGTSVSNFSVHMLDFGDLNPSLSTDHFASMTAYDMNGAMVAKQELNYTTPPERNPTESNLYGDMQISGDAASALPGQPGNWIWNVFGDGIVRVVLEFGVGYDPNIGFDTLTFTTECPQACQPRVITENLGPLAVNQSIEGLGVVAPGLNIDAKGTAIKIEKDKLPQMYLAPNTGGINGGLAATGGFSDAVTRSSLQAPLYTFTLAPGKSVSNFTLHMLDFGDLNSPTTNSTQHLVTITAYDVNGAVVAMQQLSYTTPPERNPTSSDLYGNLQISGDAASALPGQPGNWIWNVSGNGIVKVVLEFGIGWDPNYGLDLLAFTTECP